MLPSGANIDIAGMERSVSHMVDAPPHPGPAVEAQSQVKELLH